ncbi:MAG: EamA family transporter [Planctomycetes bacterium]|nr:EamA family transporter [Planctomycetota bacterium]
MSLPERFLPAIAALCAAATWALSSLLFRRLLRREGGVRPPSPGALNLFKNSLAALAIGVLWVLDGAELPSRESLPWLIGSGLLGFSIGDTLYIAALPRLGVQRASMVVLLQVPLAALLALALFGSRLSGGVVLAMLVVLVGVLLVLVEAGDNAPHARAERRRGLTLVLVATAAYSINVVIGHHGLASGALFGGSLVRVGAGMIGAFLAAPIEERVVPVKHAFAELSRPLRERALLRALLPAIVANSVIGLPLFHYALRGLEPGIAAVLCSTAPLFTLLIGRFFGERHGALAWLGTVVGFAGIAGVVYWS